MKQIYLLIILVLAVIIGSMYHKSVLNAHQAEITRWQNTYAATVDSMSVLVADGDSALVQMAQKVNKIEVDNEALEVSLKENKASLRYWATMAASYRAELDEYKNLPTADSTIIVPGGDSTEVRLFEANLGLISVAGNFDKYNPWHIRFTNAILDSIELRIGVAENRDGTWNTYVLDAPAGFNVHSMNALVNPYSPKWYEDIHLSGEVLLGSPLGIGVGAGYGQWTGKIYGTTAGVAIGTEYRIYPFRRDR